MQSISSRVSANNQIFLNPLQMIDIHVIRDMLFPTKLTSMIYTPGLIDSASPENDHNNRRNSGSHEWPNTFWGGVYCCYVWYAHISWIIWVVSECEIPLIISPKNIYFQSTCMFGIHIEEISL